MKDCLTLKQERVFRWIFEETMRRGFQPSFIEVAEHFGWTNRNATQCHVNALRLKGYVGASTSESRALRLLRTPDGEPFTGFVCKRGSDGEA
jgi:SOS-response transcriptional repressor LexA